MSNDLTLFSPPELKDTVQDMRVMFKGVNNHRGGQKRNLFFIDSLTTSKSLCKPTARLLQLPFAQRDVFIDHFQEPDFIRKQIKLLIRIADKHGEAISIAHPHIITYNILRELLPELQKKVQLVPASKLVLIPS